MYQGKTTCCHSQAVLTAFFPRKEVINLWMFENFTTVPFGIKHVPNDPNRLLDCYLDPDVGLDRAMNILGIPYEVRFWAEGSDGSEALHLLQEWSDKTPVVLGPLNMGGLPYFFHREVFQHMDHYIIILNIQNEKVQVCDPEGFILAFLPIDDLLKAWRGEQIPEGRGEFIMRRILGTPKLIYHQRTFIQTLQFAIENLLNARQKEYGGGKALQLLVNQAIAIEADVSLKRGLTYVIPTRIQRNIFIEEFVKRIQQEPFTQGYSKLLVEILLVLNKQIRIYNEVLANLTDKISGALIQLEQAALFEENITDLFMEIGDKL
jgi:hypothetical protein